MVKRCPWATTSPELLVYHDTIWGRVQKDPQKLFKALCLETMQAGLSFSTILKFEPGMDEVFHHFSLDYLAKCDQSDVERFCQDRRIIRNHAKVSAIIANAKVIQPNPKMLVEATWGPVNGVSLDHLLKAAPDPKMYQKFTEKFVKAFKNMGLQRIGLITVYSYLQAVGVVNDHLITCDFHEEFPTKNEEKSS
ncbi:DNA-3-methyladenine glycosylase I [Lentilactobacillus buchneri]|uniref:DNA-3-methyladenine glycosylase I n=1 Tax=Lentilactobacillus buchneri DSM 20057 TaxID=1423728 RepID=A0A4R5NS95_LENBU|nr:DNA-3-methyladenine glycosylase I [Lentilactobacillus buchneri]WCJ51598.1 DNA-3-methyladenine glycosylase I [Lentilactobacillus sp. Egmn17]AEB73145.1 methyladenine glycosylase [Lentilactobacillus buchneri NRRL B-30929]KRK66498.1 methyladenine glycosylase [Lentilactobacillus buchneri DSM 20057]MCT2882205.1 DNA-3-methyladenine glycosylase I [Lentilactobacillus buchneri]MCT2899606.1 DNA-3-methyladenine glycosylase I [Lentilactobacillus buchneri]